MRGCLIILKMKISINDGFRNIKEDYLFSEIAKRVGDYIKANPEKEVLKLGIGDVTLPITKSVTEAMQRAVDEQSRSESFHGYAPDCGYDFLRQAVCDYYLRRGTKISKDEVFIGDGSKSDIANFTDILGDNAILITDPVYPVYRDSNLLYGRKIEYIGANKENRFLPAPPKEEKPYVIYLCSPANPTGAVYSRGELSEWIDYALRTGSLILFDAAYEAYITDGSPRSVFEIERARECAVEFGSLSKSAGFTGTRCSYTVIPSELKVGKVKLSQLWARRQATKFNGVPYVVQRGAEAAFCVKGEAEWMENVRYYLSNAEILTSALRSKEIEFTGGRCSPYIFMKCPKEMSSWEFFDFMLRNAQLVGTPGIGFGAAGEGYFRLSAFNNREVITKAADRLKALL